MNYKDIKMTGIIEAGNAIDELAKRAAQQFDDAVMEKLRRSGIWAARWIPVAERLPEEGQAVLIVNEWGWMDVASFEYNGKAVWEDGRGYWIGFDEIVAWMPLPEPWKGE